MKKSFVVVGIILAGAAGAYAQGQFYWNDDQRGYLISIFSPNPANPTVEQTGNTIYDLPAGSTTYGGGWIGDTSIAPYVAPTSGPGGYNYQDNGNFEVGLYVATSQSVLTMDITTGTPLAITGIQGAANAGLYTASLLDVTVPGLASGTQVYVGIAAWYDDAGSDTYQAALAAGVPVGYVASTSSVALGTSGSPASIAGIGLTSFSLHTVPEPDTAALGVFGASVFLMRLRRKL